MRRKQSIKNRDGGNTARRKLRIIGGTWRGRTLVFPDLEGLRPTPDRVRETLFNWLVAHITGSRCLDLFAGSGALGLEALSRGAARCDFVERHRLAAETIEQHIRQLDAADRSRVAVVDASDFISRSRPIDSGHDQSGPFDIVFIDPPFADALVAGITQQLIAADCLKQGSLVYIEQSTKTAEADLDQRLALLRQKRAGEVDYRLYQFDNSGSLSD
ncbi:RNA methyltransferase, RsmD family [Luminiphilus syltensis NOR5-1B]|uniref:Ribosomal RNA small subunit methyltransferase D n=1 Tax=Luminiphilus syltensis NOR5-1B TaxID=565045 RepID=B8KU90_9GAMM|nr:16S rRNA (guanine(966)-N(2))-methyltransferase RsmD [Luminiphilus syltensis]EED34217.1 RNA methyltransferase, RsmD family [Luminiphilus syltensis NOR5-1B]